MATLLPGTQWITVGTIPAGGILYANFDVPSLPMQTHRNLYLQARFDSSLRTLYSNPEWITVIGRGLDICDVLNTQVGTQSCVQANNSTGQSSKLDAIGSHCAVNNLVTLHAYDLPLGQFGYALNSQGQDLVVNPGGSIGNLCLGGAFAIGRHNAIADIQNSGSTGTFDVVLNLAQLPSNPGSATVVAGQAWNFQVWHREGTTSHITNAVRVVFH